MGIKFVDYTFNLMSNGDIVLDSELTLEKLKMQNGDKFEVVFVEGVIVLKKMSNE